MINQLNQHIKTLSENPTALKYHVRTIVYDPEECVYNDGTDAYGSEGQSLKTYTYQETLDLLREYFAIIYYEDCVYDDEDMAEYKNHVEDSLKQDGITHTFQPYPNEGLVGMYPFVGNEASTMFIQVLVAE
jgi:hypothetical protein